VKPNFKTISLKIGMLGRSTICNDLV
jgi:hypothetical protein